MSFWRIFQYAHKWRAGPSAVLPLSFLYALAFGFSELPAMSYMRNIHCSAYLERSNLVWVQVFPPPVDLCRLPEVERASATSNALYLVTVTMLSAFMSGLYGRLSDMSGRKRAMATGALLNSLGDLWLHFCTQNPSLRTVHFILLSAVLKGFGGGFYAIFAIHSAFVADTSSPRKRSVYFGLSLVTCWLALSIGSTISAVLLDADLHMIYFRLAAGIWAVYLLYLFIILREARAPLNEVALVTNTDIQVGQPKAKRSLGVLLRTSVEPLVLIFRDPNLRSLGIVMFTMSFSLGAVTFLTVVCDRKFGMAASEASIIIAIRSFFSGLAVLCILPTLVFLYRRCVKRPRRSSEATSGSSSNDAVADAEHASETDPLLRPPREASSKATPREKVDVAQELLICRVCFLVTAAGMVFLPLSCNGPELIMASSFSALGAPAAPSLLALVTFASKPETLGRVLAGFSVLESAAVVIRTPTLSALYYATVETAPVMVWWFAAVLLVLCAYIVAGLRSAMLRSKVTPGADDDR